MSCRMSESSSGTFPFGLKRNGTKKSLPCSPVPVQVVTRTPPHFTNCLESDSRPLLVRSKKSGASHSEM